MPKGRLNIGERLKMNTHWAFPRTAGLAAVTLAISGCLIPATGADETPSSARPNVLFVKTDDQRADYLGCVGHPVLKTPHIDRLAARGVLFENAFATSPACTPSRACFFTGCR